MRYRWMAILATLGLVGCGDSSLAPQPGETVSPVLSAPLQWKAGQPAELGVRLQAQAGDAGKRPLGFKGIPGSTNPVARLTFFEGEQTLDTLEVALSHRC